MAHCSLIQLSNDLFQNMNYLQFLNISDNLIIKIDEKVLDPLTGLTDIDFSKYVNDLRVKGLEGVAKGSKPKLGQIFSVPVAFKA